MSQWLAAITAVRREAIQKPPKGFKTREEIHHEIGKSTSRCDTIIRQLIAAGKCERKAFRAETGAGVRMVPHFKLKK